MVMEQPTFRVVEPTRAFLQAGRPSGSHKWSWANKITLTTGTRLRYLRAGDYGDACSSIDMYWDEFTVLDGAWAGQDVLIEDAGTLHLPNGDSTHVGPRRRLGPPQSVMAERLLSPD
jgi:hypothetical protein